MNDASNNIQAQIEALGQHAKSHHDALEAVKGVTIEHAGEITAICLALAAAIATLGEEKRHLIERSLSQLLREHMSPEQSSSLRATLENRLFLTIAP